MSEKNVAVIGAGRWGKNLVRNYYKLDVLKCVCDSHEPLLKSLIPQYPGIKLTLDYQEVLNDPEIARVIIAAPAIQHFKLAKLALLANKDVFVEKPICMNCEEGDELIQIAKDKKRILMVGHLLQYHPCIIRLKEMVTAGELGKIQYISSNRLNLGSFRNEENALWNFAPHDISVILSLCNNKLPLDVRCVGASYISQGIADTTISTLRFENDIRAHIYVSWLNPFKEQKLVVIGSLGMAIFDDMQPWSDKLTLFRNYVTWSHGQIPQHNNVHAEKIQVNEEEPLRNECLHFLKCCDERIIPRTDGEEGMRVLKVLQASQESMNFDGESKNPQRITQSNYYAHPTAVIDSGAIIGKGSKIWHFSHIMQGATIGDSCNIGQNVVISPEVILGKNVKVQNNVSLYTGVICEDDVFLGPSMVFTNITNPRSEISRRKEYKNTIVKKGTTIGANATILCGIELGEYCFIGAAAVVTKNVKPYALVLGNPGRQVGWMSRQGYRLDLPLEIPPGEEMFATCPGSNETYCLICDNVSLIVEKESTYSLN